MVVYIWGLNNIFKKLIKKLFTNVLVLVSESIQLYNHFVDRNACFKFQQSKFCISNLYGRSNNTLLCLSCSIQVVRGCLIDLKEVSEEAADLRASALYTCCKFDIYLEIGTGILCVCAVCIRVPCLCVCACAYEYWAVWFWVVMVYGFRTVASGVAGPVLAVRFSESGNFTKH